MSLPRTLLGAYCLESTQLALCWGEGAGRDNRWWSRYFDGV